MVNLRSKKKKEQFKQKRVKVAEPTTSDIEDQFSKTLQSIDPRLTNKSVESFVACLQDLKLDTFEQP